VGCSAETRDRAGQLIFEDLTCARVTNGPVRRPPDANSWFACFDHLRPPPSQWREAVPYVSNALT
jgi:hypothetical protein